MDAKRLLVVLAAAMACAVTIPLDTPGIGWAITGVVTLTLLRGWLGAVAAALLGVGVFRSAGWVFALCAVTAVVLFAVTVVKGRTWRELSFALPRWVWGGWLGFRSAATTSDRHGAVRLARGIGFGALLVIVFGLLLGSAEERFADLLRPWLSWPRLVTFGGVALLCLGAFHFRENRPVTQEPAAPEKAAGAPGETPRQWGRFEWAIPVALVDLLFATFAVVQFTALFGGHEHVLDPDGPTYAEHARGGFLELATVAVLTLGVVAVVLSRIAAADGPLARVLVGLLCGLTLVIVGSALWRMRLYAEAFGFTRTRLLATAFIVWLGLILLLLLAVWRRAILPRLTLAAGALVLLGLAVLNPDRIVAETVIGRWKHDGHLDAPYVASLSPDALPALERLPEPKRSCIAAAILRNHLSRDYLWNEWNASRPDADGVTIYDLPNCEFYLSIGYRMEGNWTDPSDIRPSGGPGG